jgi:hypothetical protein
MKNALITLGDSFTYGEGIIFELIKNEYPETLQEIFNTPKNILGSKIHKLSEMIKDFDKYRIEHNYSFFLNEKLNTQLISISENGGRNIDRLMNLDFLIENIDSMKLYIPKYVVFQLTHIGRDIENILYKIDLTKDYHLKIFGKDFIDKVENASVNGKTAWDLDFLFSEAINFFLEKLELRFRILEKKYNTKCVFFFGLGDSNIIKKNYQYYSHSPYFMEILEDEKIYYTWLEMTQSLRLDLRSQIGVPDDHPTSKSHKLIADKLYQKLRADGF